jgi:hypothetical protein
MNSNRFQLFVIVIVVLLILAAFLFQPARAQDISVCVVPGLYGDVEFVVSGAAAGVGYGGLAWGDDNTLRGSAAPGESVLVDDAYLTNDGSWPVCGGDDNAYGPDGGTITLSVPAAGRTECYWRAVDGFGTWYDVAVTFPVDKEGELRCELTLAPGSDPAIFQLQ